MFKMSFFFIPIKYFIHTRIASLSKLLSWGIIYVIPTFYILFHYSAYPWLLTTIIYLLQLLIIYNFYETGYIQNDAETIKKENNPTLRLSREELAFYEKRKGIIYTVRIIAGLLLQLLLINLASFTVDGLYFFAATWAILLIYLVYNNIRNRFNLSLHFILVIIRFLCFTLLLIEIF
jgi:hypothetical protein